MNSSLFGSRGSYDYSGNYYSSPSYPYGHSGAYTAYPNPYSQYAYPYGNAHPYYERPPVQPPALVYPNTLTYGWGEPRIILPDRGLETILIAILILVALDLLFVRPRR